MTVMTEAQRNAFETALALSKTKEATREAVPTQRTRTALQGLSFGTADEIEARARSLLTGTPYNEIIDEIRGGLKAYKAARPIESTAFEVGGALVPALIPGGQSSLLRAGGRAAAEGAAYAMGTGEGTISERAERAPGGALFGAGGGAVGYGAGKLIGGSASKLADAARRTIGRRGSTIVEDEIQQLVKQTGLTPDQITQDIMDGRLLAENRTIQTAVRSLRTSGGEASTILQRGLEGRPAATRQAAMSELRAGLGDVGDGSQVAIRRASEEATRAAERQAFGSLKGKRAPDDVVAALADTLRRVPSAAKEVEIKIQADTGSKPFFRVADDGSVSFTRAPTIDEAESIRRAVSNRTSALYRTENMGGAGESVGNVETNLRGVLDFSIPELSSVRAQAAAIRTNRDAYKAGAGALSGDVNEKIADFDAFRVGENAEEAVAAFRAGVMKLLEARATTGSRQTMVRNLADPTSKEGKLLMHVFPEDQIDAVLKSLDIANDAQAAAGRILIGTGADTAGDIKETARRNSGIGLSEVAAAMSGNPAEAVGVVSKLVGRLTRSQLTDAENARIAEMLVSSDPQLVRRAIVDEGAMQALADTVNKIAVGLRRGGRTLGASQAAPIGGDVSQGLLSQ